MGPQGGPGLEGSRAARPGGVYGIRGQGPGLGAFDMPPIHSRRPAVAPAPADGNCRKGLRRCNRLNVGTFLGTPTKARSPQDRWGLGASRKKGARKGAPARRLAEPRERRARTQAAVLEPLTTIVRNSVDRIRRFEQALTNSREEFI